jgi:hypothetical protein
MNASENSLMSTEHDNFGKSLVEARGTAAHFDAWPKFRGRRKIQTSTDFVIVLT